MIGFEEVTLSYVEQNAGTICMIALAFVAVCFGLYLLFLIASTSFGAFKYIRLIACQCAWFVLHVCLFLVLKQIPLINEGMSQIQSWIHKASQK